MIKRLKIQFIFINMLLISIVIITAFTLLSFSFVKKMENDSYKSIDEGIKQIASERKDFPVREGVLPPSDNTALGMPSFETFYILIDYYGNVVSLNTSGITDEIDEEEIISAVNKIQESNKKKGVIKDLNLRYSVYTTDNNGAIIGFIDISYERSMIRRQVIIYIIMVVSTLIAFFFISMFLSNLVIKPIEKSWKQQQQFVSDASHELKTPISVILANTSILLSDKNSLTEKNSKWVDYIDLEAKRMKDLIKNLLFLSRADVSKEQNVSEKFCISDTIWESVLPFEAVLFESNKSIETVIQPDLYIKGNSGQIKQLISILLDNACKYAISNSQVKLLLYEQNDKVMIEVNNKSKPIPKDELPHIFDRFYKVDKARSRTSGSYGLGLSIAKEIVKSHNGKIIVSSDKANGTTFKVVLSKK